MSLYKERLYWHIRKIVKSHDDADDALQNTFIKVYKSIDKFKGNSKLFSWMYRIATNEAITLINQNAKRFQITSEEINTRAVNNLQSDVYFEGSEIQLQLQKAIATLPQKQQLVFNMKYFDDIKYKDMSDILETSEGALKASYHLAVKKIESYLTQD
ncbi:MAG: sigma-70 family RNA polymerase sigma factor [Bacteroidia bacterium]|nr:sigma-70 family RNA polymerase sigma factor [Bacteroidia bacterium]NND25056.1 sigma-70 family RNA polymerase sigma factor [Flavobacteriaceae bacterium]MBT8279394.1 sigma-70 family RNA polymerase sigma factor [Bacteroidia bacterium]NNK59390.1 sigma-70 family RNA polymerase sigma factor [Flavobacteriaceae bacterium]NNL33802.1 sigma-70 family RNA polymerase sigma factor [Flavobacteriaceae bacterium]